MANAYKVQQRTIRIGERKSETVFTISPVSFGTLTTEEAARQIAAESTTSPGDVKNVLDRYAYYVTENLKKGYCVELLGFGRLYLRFITSGSATDPAKANASLVKSPVPGFRPAYTMVNNSRKYSLVPDKISLVKYTDLVKSPNTNPDEGNGDDTTGGGNTENPDNDRLG